MIRTRARISDTTDGRWIRQQRLRRDLSQARLARLSGLSQARLSAWETGKKAIPATVAAELERFFARLDLDHGRGRIGAQKRRPGRSVRLSTKAATPPRSTEPALRFAPAQRPAPGPFVEHLNRLAQLAEERGTCSLPRAIALFSGIGGMSLGFTWAGFDVVGHVELNTAARAIYESNFPQSIRLGADVREISEIQIKSWKRRFGHIAVLFGGPPCQGFSLAGKRDREDPRNRLYEDFARIAAVLKPDVVVMENVRLLTSMKTPEGTGIPGPITTAFASAGYDCRFAELNAENYGVPQFRERVFFIGVRGRRIPPDVLFPLPTHGAGTGRDLITFRDATGDLESLESGHRSAIDPWHFAVTHPAHVIHWLANVPEGESAHGNSDPALRPPSGYNTTYKRVRWDEPCSTVGTTFGMISASRNVHPVDTRSLTIREAMRCQSFPDDFKLAGRLGDIRTGLGNAVPPLLAQAIAEQVRSWLLTLQSPPVSRLTRNRG